MDTAALRRHLDGKHRATRERVRDLLHREDFLPPQGMTTAEHRAWVLARVTDIAGRGDVGPTLGFPAAVGGQDDVGAGVAAFEQLAQGDLSLLVKVGVQFGLFGGAILHLGTEKHHERYLPDVLTLALPGCFAMTEADHGSDVQSLATTITFDEGELVVHTPDDGAHKEYIGNAAQHGRLAVVFGQLCLGGEEHGVHAVLVPIRDAAGRARPGVRIEASGEKVGLNGVDNGRLGFDHVRVPLDALLDRYGRVAPDGSYSSPIENPSKRFFTMLGTLVQGRVSVGGAATGATKVAQTIAVRHGEQRRQFETPDGDEARLLDYPAHQRKLLPALARTYALTFAQAELLDELAAVSSSEPTGDARELEAHAAGLKAIQTRHATDTIQACREACGGLGYLSRTRFAALKADTDVFTTFEGDNTVLLQLVAKDLLQGFADAFGHRDALGKAAFVAEQLVVGLAERTGVLARAEDLLRGEVDDPAYLRGLLEVREAHIVSSLAQRLRGLVQDGVSPYDAFLRCQDHALRAAEAHVEHRVAQAFARGVEAAPASVRDVLADVERLHLLAVVEDDRAWFVEHGRITGGRSKEVVVKVMELCAALRPHARDLVDAFAVPEQFLGGASRSEPGPDLRVVA